MADKVSTTYEIGDGLKVVDDVLIVETTDKAEKNNQKAITSHGVALEVGNLEVLLATI